MSTAFNPYHEWLGLSRRVTQPNFYELLGLEESATDVKAIASAADRAASKVRSQRPGTHAAEWAQLLDQIANAKTCLTDPQQRRDYDLRLRAKKQGNVATSVSPQSPRVAAPIAPRSAASPSAPIAVPTSPSGVPYLKPLDEVSDRATGHAAPNPMAPVGPVPTVPFAAGAPPLQIPSPMAPMAYPANTPGPMAPVLPTSPSPYPVMNVGATVAAPHAIAATSPAGPMINPGPTTPGPFPQISPGPVPRAPGTLGSIPAQPLSINAPSSVNHAPVGPVVVTNTAWEQSQRRDRSGLLGPIVVGVGIGLVLLGIIAVASFMKSRSDNRETAGGTGGSENAPVESAGDSKTVAPAVDGETSAATTALSSDNATKPDADKSSAATQVNGSERTRDLDSPPDPKPNTAPIPADSQPAMPAKTNDSDPKPAMPDSKPATDTKPTPNTKPATPEPKPEPAPEPKKLSNEDLVRLGRALQRARTAIGEHDFERAQELLKLADDLAKDTPHQPKLDRLRILLNAVKQYHEAILTSISKLEVGVTFEVGGSTVGVVEAARDKLVLRVAGQNRGFPTDELPLGVAAALAEQTLAPTDPTNILFKWAYVITSPKASKDELDKARRYLDEASASDEDAKSIQMMLSDKYDLGAER